MLAGIASLSGCQKYLDAKPDKHLGIPSTLTDYQALLDSYSKINFKGVSSISISSDDYYLTDQDFARLSDPNKNMYLWKDAYVFGSGFNDWANVYIQVYYANTALNNIPSIKRAPANAKRWDNAMGEGYFIRANAFFQIALAWCKAYNQQTAQTDLGIPLRLTTDFNEKSKRSNLQQTFDQIVADLKKATLLLPESQEHPMRPGRPAAFGLLARVYLYMRDYPRAYLYADSCLQLKNELMNFNELDPAMPFTIPLFNKEDLFHQHCTYISTKMKVDSALYNSYASDDLRKTLFFKDVGDGSHQFRGSYTHNKPPYIGVATDEVYLMKSECEARMGKLTQAMKDLNTLLSSRWKSGMFTPYTASTEEEALALILAERRKELLWRLDRWMDVKRLNMEGYNITMTRVIDGQTYTLTPNNPRFALPIPEDIILLSGMRQNTYD